MLDRQLITQAVVVTDNYRSEKNSHRLALFLADGTPVDLEALLNTTPPEGTSSGLTDAFRIDHTTSPPTSGTTEVAVCDDSGNIVASVPRSYVVGKPVFYVNQSGKGGIYTVTASGNFTSEAIPALTLIKNLLTPTGGLYIGVNSGGVYDSIDPEATSTVIQPATDTTNPFNILTNGYFQRTEWSRIVPLVVAVHDANLEGQSFWAGSPGGAARSKYIDGVPFSNTSGEAQGVVFLKDQPDPTHNGFVEVIHGDPTQSGQHASVTTQLNGRWDYDNTTVGKFPLFGQSPFMVGVGNVYGEQMMITQQDGLTTNAKPLRQAIREYFHETKNSLVVTAGDATGVASPGAISVDPKSNDNAIKLDVTFESDASTDISDPILYVQFGRPFPDGFVAVASNTAGWSTIVQAYDGYGTGGGLVLYSSDVTPSSTVEFNIVVMGLSGT